MAFDVDGCPMGASCGPNALYVGHLPKCEVGWFPTRRLCMPSLTVAKPVPTNVVQHPINAEAYSLVEPVWRQSSHVDFRQYIICPRPNRLPAPPHAFPTCLYNLPPTCLPTFLSYRFHPACQAYAMNNSQIADAPENESQSDQAMLLLK